MHNHHPPTPRPSSNIGTRHTTQKPVVYANCTADPQQRRQRRHKRVRQSELVEMVYVRYAEVERGEEDQAGPTRCGELAVEMESQEEGAEEKFLGQGGGDVVAETRSRSRGLRGGEGAQSRQWAQFIFDDEFFRRGDRRRGGWSAGGVWKSDPIETG